MGEFYFSQGKFINLFPQESDFTQYTAWLLNVGVEIDADQIEFTHITPTD
jgi:hypothetical protein